MTAKSAGILVYRRRADDLEVLLVHPGGPFWARRDAGAWSVPKGEYSAAEEPADAARREFAEEVGAVPAGELALLGEFKLSSSKLLVAFALEGEFDHAALASNSFEMEWPPRSGKLVEFPEIDRAEWMEVAAAAGRIVKAQAAFLDRLRARLGD